MISRAAQSDKKASDKKGLSEKVVEVVKVNRYRPGVKPQFAGEGEQASLELVDALLPCILVTLANPFDQRSVCF